LLDDLLRLLVFTFTEVVETNPSLGIDEVVRRPVIVPEGPPDGEVVIDRDWEAHVEFLERAISAMPITASSVTAAMRP
jgi:hypothetical protein